MNAITVPVTQTLARFEGARFYARTMGFCAVFPPGPVAPGDDWSPHPAHDDTFRADGAPELIVSRPDCRLVLGRFGRKLDMKRVRQLSSEVLQGASPVAVRVAPLAVALPLHGELRFELPRRALRCLPIPIREQEPAQYGNVTLRTHVTCSQGALGGSRQLWLETSLIQSPRRRLHFAGDLRQLLRFTQGDVPDLIATMVEELIQTEQVLTDLQVDAAAESQRRRLGVARLSPDGVAVDVRLPSPGRDLHFTVLDGAVLPRGT